MGEHEVETKRDMEKIILSRMKIITASISFISIAAVMIVGYMIINMKSQIEELYQKIEYGNRKVEINDYEDSKREKKNRLIFKYLLTSIYGSEIAEDKFFDILKIFYPDDAQYLMQHIDFIMSDSGDGSDEYALMKEDQQNGIKKEWGIVVGSDKSIGAAEYELRRAKDQNFSAKIYKKGRRFMTILGPFANHNKVKEIIPLVKKDLNKTSYVINYHTWCKQQVARDQYVECGISNMNLN